MFSFFKRKKPETPATDAPRQEPDVGADDSVAAPSEAEQTAIEVESATSEAQRTSAQPESAAVKPESAAAEPESAALEPESTAAEPESTGAERESGEVGPGSPGGPAEVAPAENVIMPNDAFHDSELASPGSATTAEPVVSTNDDAAAPAPSKSSWLSRLREGLSRTGQSISGIFVGVKVDEDLFEELETALIMADTGMEATEKLLTALRARVRKEKIADAEEVKAALREILAEHLKPLEKPFPLGAAKPLVVMIAGVNGAGKTTSIGKLAHAFQAQGASVLLAAADTFRAAAREQLMEWGARNDVTVIAQEGGDPAAVAFDAVNAGRAREASVVMVDTAGRLPTQLHLMEELKKIKRVIRKADGSAPHEVLLVVDGNTGQNAIAQVKAFDAAIELTGLVVTKLDGTAKGGTLAAIAAGSQGVRPVPVYWIGVGEGMHDLQPFVAQEFAAAMVGD